MLRRKIFLFALLILPALLAACTVTLPEVQDNSDTLFQASTLSSLNVGNFEGEVTMAELKRHGDFGLGTYNMLDGEMVVLDGEIYQMRDDGIAYLADESTQTPFAAVTFFEADQSLAVNETLDCSQLQAHLDSVLPTLDAPYAIKVSGEFASLKVRAPHKQSRPYPTLADALVDQAVFESQNISGTMVGFRLPDYLAGANATGYHFHFLRGDRQAGGHVLECQTSALSVEIDTIDEIRMDLRLGSAER
jgi:acetolactate decarboxylase